MYDRVPREILGNAIEKKDVRNVYIQFVYEWTSTSVGTHDRATNDFLITIELNQG